MLSRVGSRLYWMGRYVERAESSARLIRVYRELFLDLPRGAGVGWQTVLDINGVEQAFADSGRDPQDPGAIVQFLLADEANPTSLLRTLEQARENARTTRDIIPTEAWRVLNELYLMATERIPAAVADPRQSDILASVVQRCQLLTGLIGGTMSHGDGFQLLRLGWHLERADMTTRIIDVATALLINREAELKRFDNTLWMAVLRSVSGYQMYRQYARRRVTAHDVIGFLMADRLFPRSVTYCVDEMEAAIGALPRRGRPAGSCAAIRALQEDVTPGELAPAELHLYLDELQRAFAALNDDAYTTWFSPAVSA